MIMYIILRLWVGQQHLLEISGLDFLPFYGLLSESRLPFHAVSAK